MKKLTSVLSVGSMAAYGFSFFSTFFVIVFQSLLKSMFFENSAYAQDFAVPLSPLFYNAGMLVLAIVAFLIIQKGNSPMWVNILLIALPILVLSPLTSGIAAVQSHLINGYGLHTALSYSLVNRLISYGNLLNAPAYGAYLVCGGIRLSENLRNKQ